MNTQELKAKFAEIDDQIKDLRQQKDCLRKLTGRARATDLLRIHEEVETSWAKPLKDLLNGVKVTVNSVTEGVKWRQFLLTKHELPISFSEEFIEGEEYDQYSSGGVSSYIKYTFWFDDACGQEPYGQFSIYNL
jgi:hypothetical protein